MGELTIEQLIKIILGVFVVVVVVLGIYFIFKEKIIDFFKNLPTGENPKNITNITKLILSLI